MARVRSHPGPMPQQRVPPFSQHPEALKTRKRMAGMSPGKREAARNKKTEDQRNRRHKVKRAKSIEHALEKGIMPEEITRRLRAESVSEACKTLWSELCEAHEMPETPREAQDAASSTITMSKEQFYQFGAGLYKIHEFAKTIFEA